MKFEYLKTGGIEVTTMNKLGTLGWELVAVIGHSTGLTATMFFKRQIKED